MVQVVFGDKVNVRESLAQMVRNYDLYVGCFPDPDERETLRKLQLLFLRVPGWNYAQLFVEGELIAVCQFCVVSSKSAFLEHIFVSEENRLRGYGSMILAAVEEHLWGMDLRYVCAEMNDAHIMTEQEYAADFPKPEERNIFWLKKGYRCVNGSYRQPALEDWVASEEEEDLIVPEEVAEEAADEEEAPSSVDYLCVIVKSRFGGNTIPTEDFEDTVAGYFGTFLPAGEDPRQDPCFVEAHALHAGLASLDLIEIGSRRSICQNR